MFTLEGKTLCERQKKFNAIVKEAAEKKISLEGVHFAGNPDIDRIFKIDLASKYKNIDYIIKELKSGDSLYISRSLKCRWLYDIEFAHVINPDYLHEHVFPTMSLNLKKKTLSTISIFVREQSRAQSFCKYCVDAEMKDLAAKFLIFTSVSYKKQYLALDNITMQMYLSDFWEKKPNYFVNLIGNSFELADEFLSSGARVRKFSFLYSVDNVEYLKLLKEHGIDDICPLGLKISRLILKKHKNIILQNPSRFLEILNESALIKYSSTEDAKVYVKDLLPDTSSEFWEMNFYERNKYVIDLIKSESKYKFLKAIFSDKYKDKPFETTVEFYEHRYYEMMTFAERKAWARKHLKKNLGVIPEKESYLWYQFLPFNTTFKEILKQMLGANKFSTRLELIRVLIMSAKTQRDLKKLFDYIYKRCVDVHQNKKEKLIHYVINYHNIYEFGESCWNAFNQILQTMQVYTTPSEHKTLFAVALIYNIINNKPLPDVLLRNVSCVLSVYNLNPDLLPLTDGQKDAVYKFLYQYCMDKIMEFETKEYNDDNRVHIRLYLEMLVEHRMLFRETGKYPDVAIKYMRLDKNKFESVLSQIDKNKQISITEGCLIRFLKTDPSLVITNLPLLKDTLAHSSLFRMNTFLRKIQLYFSDNIGKPFLDILVKDLYNLSTETNMKKLIDAIVFAIFQLGDEKLKVKIMEKNAPTDPKINRNKIEKHVIYIQEAICQFHCHSRPPVPLSSTSLYIKGDYVHKCKEIFNMYAANLTPALRADFIKLLLNFPVSVQKRALHLVFKTYDSKDMIDFVKKFWETTPDVTLRKLMYVTIFEAAINWTLKAQKEFFELLIKMTKSLNQFDDDAIFQNIYSFEIIIDQKSSYLQAVWETITVMTEKRTLKWKKLTISCMLADLHVMDIDFLLSLIHEHIRKTLTEQKLRPVSCPHTEALSREMWDLVVRFIIDIPDETGDKSVHIVRCIVEECFSIWEEDYNTEEFVAQNFFARFVSELHKKTCYTRIENKNLIHIYEYLLESFRKRFKLQEMYSYFWDWNLAMVTLTVIDAKWPPRNSSGPISFGLQLGTFLREIVDKNQYYSSCCAVIDDKLKKYTTVLESIRDEQHFQCEDISIFIAYGLCLCDFYEAYAFAINILPTDLSLRKASKVKLKILIRKIQEQNVDELDCMMNEKFVVSGHKIWEVLTPVAE